MGIFFEMVKYKITNKMKITFNQLLFSIVLIGLLCFATDKTQKKKETVCFMCKSYSVVNLINSYSKLGYSVKYISSESISINNYSNISSERGGFLVVMEK